MKTTLMRTISLLIVAIMITLTLALPAFAATKANNYGFIWQDDETSTWYIQYYKYNSSEKAYEISDYAYLKKSTLYDKSGNIISENVKSMSDTASTTVAFDENANLYFITKSGDVCKMEHSTDATYAKNSKLVGPKFTLNADDLLSGVNLTFTGSYSRNDENDTDDTKTETEVKSDKNYVKTYAFNGDPTKTAYDAYKDGKVIISVYCKGSNVWNQTSGNLLSSTCIGAKFVGYTKDYFTIMYDLDGTVYCFPYGDWSVAFPISLDEEIKSYQKDINGFVKSITTSKKTYNLESLMEEYGCEQPISYVENSTTKSVGYNSFDEVVSTLEKKNNYLYWNGEKLCNSYKPTFFGLLVDDGSPVWISNNNLYRFNLETGESVLVKQNVVQLRYNDNGFVYQYRMSTKN